MKTVVIAVIVTLLICAGFLAGFLLIPRSNTASNLPEHLIITDVDYGVGSEGWIAVTLNNIGIADVNIAKLLVNNVKQVIVNPALPVELAPDSGIVINATMDIVSSGTYQIDVLTSKGNMFSKLSSVPTIQQAGVMLCKVNVNFMPGKIAIGISNSGTSDTEILQVYIGTSASTIESQTIAPSTPISLAAGSIASFNVTYSWAPGTTYYFKVVPNSGAALTFQEQAPQ